jgi:signal peptidase
VENLSLSNYAATGSMIPALDENSNGIRIKPASPEQISAGDIVTFRRGEDLIVHRVIEMGNDEKGVWFVTKGDNSDLDDGKIYFSQVEYVTIGVLY